MKEGREGGREGGRKGGREEGRKKEGKDGAKWPVINPLNTSRALE